MKNSSNGTTAQVTMQDVYYKVKSENWIMLFDPIPNDSQTFEIYVCNEEEFKQTKNESYVKNAKKLRISDLSNSQFNLLCKTIYKQYVDDSDPTLSKYAVKADRLITYNNYTIATADYDLNESIAQIKKQTKAELSPFLNWFKK